MKSMTVSKRQRRLKDSFNSKNLEKLLIDIHKVHVFIWCTRMNRVNKSVIVKIRQTCLTLNPHQQLAATSMQLWLKDQDLSFGIFRGGRTPSQRDVCCQDRFTDPQQVFLGLHSDRVFPADDADAVSCSRSLQLKLWGEPRLLLGRWIRKPPRQRFMERPLLLGEIWDSVILSISLTCFYTQHKVEPESWFDHRNWLLFVNRLSFYFLQSLNSSCLYLGQAFNSFVKQKWELPVLSNYELAVK